MQHHFIICDSQAGYRLDKAITILMPSFSRARIQALIEAGHVTHQGSHTVSPSMKVKKGDMVQVIVPASVLTHPLPQDISLDIVYEDDDLLVLNKPAGMVVHPAPGHLENTLVNALLAHCGTALSSVGGVWRPGIVHRLDKDTSGLMVIAKNDDAHQGLSMQFRDRTLSRHYQALVWGIISSPEGDIQTCIGRNPHNRQKMAVVSCEGKPAHTLYHTRRIFTAAEGVVAVSWVECQLQTGRTHQIRVHMAHMGHPILGDPIYGSVPQSVQKIVPKFLKHIRRQALHAYKLILTHPRSGRSMAFEQKLAPDIVDLLQQMEAW